MFKGPREHRPELASLSMVSKDTRMKQELGFESEGSDDVSDHETMSEGETEPNRQGYHAQLKVEVQAMQHQLQMKDNERRELMASLKASQSELMKCRRELNKEKNVKSTHMKVLKKSHADAVQDKQKLISELSDVVEEKEGIIEELTAKLQGGELKIKRGKANSVRQLVDQISKLHGEKAALNEKLIVSHQECDRLHQECDRLRHESQEFEKTESSTNKHVANGVKVEVLEERDTLIRELEEENTLLKQQIEDLEEADPDMEESLSKMEDEVRILTTKLKEAQLAQKGQEGIQREKEEIRQQLKDMEARVVRAEEERKKMKGNWEEARVYIQKLESKLDVSSDEVKNLQVEILEYKATTEQQGKKQSDVTAENSSLRVALRKESDRATNLNAELSKMAQLVSGQKAELETLQKEGRMLRQLVADKEKLEQELEKTKEQVNVGEKALEQAKETIRVTEEKARDQLAAAKAERQVAVDREKRRAENQMKQLQSTVNSMSVKVKDFKRELDTGMVTFKELRMKHEVLHATITPAIQTVQSKILKAIADVNETNKALVAKYKKEMRLRKRLHNEITEMKGNIRVFCRVRPTIREDGTGPMAQHIASFDHDDDQLVHVMSRGSMKTFEMDHVFQPESTQQSVFNEVKGLITSCMDGYNVCIFAYGQTGSGKTFTMEGSETNPGVNPRALDELFLVATERSHDWDYAITMSVLEIYNEQIRDLLGEDPAARMDIRQQTDGRIFVPGLNWVQVKSRSDVQEVFSLGRENRATACTNMNEHSSRSHALLCVNVQGTNNTTGSRTSARLNLIDLAGSERVSKSGTEGERLKEAQNINKSLSSLGDVIHALRAKASHVPFRNSKLSYLLQDSLSGDSKTLMIVQVSPVEKNSGETICSLSFAARVRSVELGQASRTSDSAEIAALKDRLRLYEDPSAVSQVTGLPKRGSGIPSRKK